MKYGLLYYKDTDNLGDDIQAYASSQFLPRIDYLIDRESLEDFCPSEKSNVKVIMNSWYIHNKFDFDLSPFITPLFISVFLKSFPYEAGIIVGTKYLNKNIQQSFIKYGPVGARDEHTRKILKNLKISNYFSGCMTLTIKKFSNIEKGDYVVTVGLSEEEINYLKTLTKRKIVNFVQDIKEGSLKNETWEQRKARVENILKLYQKAHMVITTKLHCALPCLALETPLLFLYDTSFPENIDRIGTYIPYLNYIKREDLMYTTIDLENPKENPKKHLKLREELTQRCTEFIKNKESLIEELPEPDVYKSNVLKSKNMREIPIQLLNELQKTYEKECEKSDKLCREIKQLNESLNSITKDYNIIINSKGWKYLEKIRRIKNKILKKS